MDLSQTGLAVPNDDITIGGSSVATESWAKGNNIAVGDLSGVSGQGDGDGLNADMVDGSHASAFALSGHDHALGDLSNVSATGEGHSNGLNADTVDGSHASELSAIDTIKSGTVSVSGGNKTVVSGYSPSGPIIGVVNPDPTDGDTAPIVDNHGSADSYYSTRISPNGNGTVDLIVVDQDGDGTKSLRYGFYELP